MRGIDTGSVLHLAATIETGTSFADACYLTKAKREKIRTEHTSAKVRVIGNTPRNTRARSDLGGTYHVIDGKKIFEGDIVLEQVDEPNPSGIGNPGIGIIYPANLWPNAGNIFQIPYTITVGDQKVTDSITSFNNIFSGFMQWVPRTTETDYVDFNLDVNNHSGSWRKKGHLNFLDGPSPGLQTSVPTIHR